MNKKILIATTNQGKINEILKILETAQQSPIEIVSLNDYSIPEPHEPFDTFQENAIHKARYYGQLTNLVTLADDSGLCIEELNGFPGVKTKDFAELCGNFKKAFLMIEKMLAPRSNKNSYFQTTFALYDPEKDQYITYEAQLFGQISFPPRGTEGFGFDPIFIPTGFDMTLAELGNDIKNNISHRVQALQKMIQELKN